MSAIPFDSPEARCINEARKAFLDGLMPDILKTCTMITAVDAGCGFGFFADYLDNRALKVMAFDGRPDNIATARERYPRVEFKIRDIEDPSTNLLGGFDLSLCFGVLYHLENPFRAVRNLASLTKKVLLLETVIVPTNALAAYIYEEEQRDDQGLNYIAMIPTEAWLVKSLYRSGFPFVYKPKRLPDHNDFRASWIKRQRRICLVASKVELLTKLLDVAIEPEISPYIWDSFVIRFLSNSGRVRKFLKSCARVAESSREKDESAFQ